MERRGSVNLVVWGAVPRVNPDGSSWREPPRRGWVRIYCLLVDILIMILLLVITVLVWRGANRGTVIGLWLIGIVAVISLFRFHVTSTLDLSF